LFKGVVLAAWIDGIVIVSVKSFLVSHVSAYFTGPNRLVRQRQKVEAKRKRQGASHLITYFHQVDDPYSHLAMQALGLLMERYNISFEPHLVGPPADWATPERGFLKAYARLDASKLARVSGLSFPENAIEPSNVAITHAQHDIARALGAKDFVAVATQAGTALWANKSDISGPHEPVLIEDEIKRGEAKRHELGHFMSAMFHYGGEWYWGLDRLHFLEQRLRDLGLQKPGAPPDFIWMAPIGPKPDAKPKIGGKQKEIEYFLSFRSPYTYIATARVKALADAYGAKLKLRFVLPMVMRGLAVPPMKSRYFALDTAREARRLGVPFGRICDPLGKPVERGYAILPWAIEQGRGFEFALSFMQKVWSEGVDAGTDTGLARIVTEAGLDWSIAKTFLGDQSWRAEAEANRLELVALGHWGVPCFACGDTVVWGQDRLWVIEEALRA
jgi:2-hydroxychromene-2-carboxylate isomerase